MSVKRLHTYSQHFLRNPRLVAELVGHSSIRRGDMVIDIGAGSGTISSVLARRAAAVVAIEPEPRTARTLRANMARFSNVTVVQKDFLSYDLPHDLYKVFANIPFHLSSEIVQKLVFAPTPPKAIYVIVQKQFARKLLANGNYFTSQLGMMIAPWWTVRIRRPLKKTDFWPHPAVDTVLLELKLRETPLVDNGKFPAYRQFVTRCYEEPKFFHSRTGKSDSAPSRLSSEEFVALYQNAQKAH